MAATIALVTLTAAVVGTDSPPAYIQFGSDRARGVLVNLTPGAHPGEPPVAERPTLVFVHGFNPMPGTVHFTMAEHMADALVRRVGARFNMLAWDWNAATFVSLDPRANHDSAVAQGQILAETLRRSGIRPARLQLIGHSAGGIVAAAAARYLDTMAASANPERVAQLTLLDPASSHHPLIFGRLGAATSARRVENYWSPDPGAYGRQVNLPGVLNTRINGPHPCLGLASPRRSSHMYIVTWYIGTIREPGHSLGFNQSVLLTP